MNKIIQIRFILFAVLNFAVVVTYNGCSEVSFTPTENSSVVLIQSTSQILINNGAPFTNDSQRRVTLTLRNKAARQMYVTNDANCAQGGEWQNYATSLPWTLQSRNERNEVFARFRGTTDSLVSDCVKASIVHDDIAPAVEVETIAQYVNNQSVHLGVYARDEASQVSSIQCQSDGSNILESCLQGYNADDLQEGQHSLSVIAQDGAGNVSQPVTRNWIVDVTPPTVSFNSTPPLVSNSYAGQFRFNGSDALSPISSYLCKIDHQPAVSCTSPTSITTVGDGAHTFQVAAIDAAGNSSNFISYTWTVDATQPSVRITKGPMPLSSDPRPTFEFVGSDRDTVLTQFLCQIDQTPATSCASPMQTVALGEGQHTFTVKAKSSTGKLSSPATYSWIVDVTAPTVSLTRKPDPRTNSTTADFAISVSDNFENTVTVLCALDGATLASCTQTPSYNQLSDGNHQFQVVAKDEAGNSSAVTTYIWFVDNTPPTIRITNGPSAITTQTQANFVLDAKDGNGGTITRIECKLDSALTFSICSATPTFSNLTPGDHTLVVRAVDSVGNVSSQDEWKWVVSQNGPAIVFQQIPSNPLSQTSPATVQYTVTDSIFTPDKLTVRCGFDNVLTDCSVADTITKTNMPLGNHSFTVTASNPAGLTSTKTTTWAVKNIIQFPSFSSLAAITYEDLFPKHGDADFNDFVLNFRIVGIVNANQQITRIVIDFYPRAAGAGYDHALFMVLDGQKDSPSNITAVTQPLFSGGAQVSLTRYDDKGVPFQTLTGLQASKDIEIFASTHALFGNGTLKGTINTDASSYVAPNQSARLEIVLTDPSKNPAPSDGKWNIQKFRPVLRVKNTSQDIDLIDAVATNYDNEGYPFGFIIPTNWQWPTSGVNINNVYPQFPSYRNYLLQKAINPDVTVDPTVLDWFKYPVPGSKNLYPLPQAPNLLPDPS